MNTGSHVTKVWHCDQHYFSINRVFPKVDHSARIVLVESTVGSVAELNFC